MDHAASTIHGPSLLSMTDYLTQETDPDLGQDLAFRRLRSRIHSRVFGDPPRPVAFGDYEIVDYLGSGGMGVVYAARDPKLDRTVALKLLRPELITDDMRARLMREAKLLASLSHPNLVHVYEAGEAEDRLYLAMELVDGEPLSSWLAKRPRTTREVLAIFRAIGRGLAAAHKKGVVHRDFKPENVLVDAEGQVKVVDFGLACASGDQTEGLSDQESVGLSRLTRPGSVMGTPRYLSPEQFLGQPVDPRADLFAFCVALYEALFGQAPFAGDDLRTLSQNVLQEHIEHAPRGRGVPSRIRRAVTRGLSRDASQRPASMEELLNLLEDRPARGKLLAGSLAAAVGVGALAFALLPPKPASTCAGGADKVAPVWGDAQRSEMSEHFSAERAAHVAATGRALVQDLDGYARDWEAAYAHACTESAGQPGPEAEAAYRHMRCLDRRLAEFDALVDTVTQVAPTSLGRKGSVSTGLFPIADCAATSSLASPVGAEGSQDASAVISALGRIRALRLAGLRQEARAAAEALGADPDTAPFAALRLEARILEASTDVDSKTSARIARLESAAREAHHTDQHELLVEATVELLGTAAHVEQAYYPGDRLSQESRAQITKWAEVAVSIVEAGAPRSAMAARLYEARGHFHREQMALEMARSDLQHALELREALGDELARAQTLVGLGWVETSAEQLDLATEHLHTAAALQADRLGKEHPLRARTLLRLAVVHHKRSNLDRAIALTREALEINRATLPANGIEVARAEQTLKLFERETQAD
jgi:tRNA A-37 threonylcarbamoyl transferase component Bud32/tetratricopeptide (TPR) repeat protein